MRKPKYQFFSLQEYQRRLDALRSRMERNGVEAMLVTTPENLYYLTGYQTPGYYWFQTLIVPMDREPVFITRLGEATNIEPMSWVEDSRPYDDTQDWIAKTKGTLDDLGLARQRIGLEYRSWFMTIDDYLHLSAVLPDTRFVDCSSLVEQGRMIKSPQEIEYIRQAARTAEAGIRAGIEASVVGATENEVAAEVHRAQILAGSEYTGLPIFVSSAERADMTHATWYRRRLEPSDMVHMEIPGCINRYHAAKWTQVYLGDPPDQVVSAFAEAIKINRSLKAIIKAGVKAEDVWEAMREMVEGAGLGSEQNARCGYGIGIGFAPDWGEGHIISIVKGEERPLQAGMTFHLTGAHGLNLPGGGKARCTDTILVTEKGCETLTDGLEQRLYVK